MLVSPPAADQMSWRALTPPGGWPASCPATYRSTHGHRHVRNWASHRNNIFGARVNTFDRARASRRTKYSARALRKFSQTVNQRARSALAARRRQPSVNGSTRRAFRMKRTITATPQRKKTPWRMWTLYAFDVKQVGEGPAGGEGGAEHLGADQDRRAEHGQHVEPDDAAALRPDGGVHRSFLGSLLPAIALQRVNALVARRNVVDMGGGIKAASAPRSSASVRRLTAPSWSAARSRSAGRGR